MPGRPRTWDHALFAAVADHHWPGAERALPRLSHAADRSRLWWGLAGAMAFSGLGGVRARRAAVRGVASLAVASATVNTIAKGAVRRRRPLLDAVPAIRQLKAQPVTTSFPSGHAASAAAFATGVALESRGWGALVAPLAASVAFSRVYTGVHYPSDVLAGAAIGAGVAVVVRRLLTPRPPAPPSQPLVAAPALPAGRGLCVVANPGSGTAEALHALRTELPEAAFTLWSPGSGPLTDALEEAAARAAEEGGALGVLGGDGTVNAAAPVALRHDVPLAVLPGGTFNHLAVDLGIHRPADVLRALESGDAIAVDLARFVPGADAGRHGGAGHFVNTFSLGVYGELVEVRERWSGRVGSWPASLLAALAVLRHARPVELTINGRRRSVWLLFAGNCAYSALGGTAARRSNLADGQLEVHVVHGGRWARVRLLSAAATGLLHRSPVHAAARVAAVRLTGIRPGTVCAFDGETAPAPPELLLDKEKRRLTVYRPLPVWMTGLDPSW
ncbi:bifunctional phosphatase PAP2/diacylglycerol kinase family protein [Streptomyces chumphonensis]|uniref:Phosphatase PAP2 family protein n=1 Tax=Streptomyces chumphonensis TaxID=1214925 RepID=A0A927EY30_9ACTN|nr:phosphatase PAP2 family protein [Streptomyces chumphonensis]MBD3931508.1 phosphatase PAP2 family protein [Streptomyces chumphonensis]